MCYVMVLWQLTCACVNLQHLQTKSNYPCTPPQIWYNYISYPHPSPPPLCPIVCIAILSHDVKVYLSPYQITVEGTVLIHLHSFEWCTLTRIHNIVYFLIARTHTHKIGWFLLSHTHSQTPFWESDQTVCVVSFPPFSLPLSSPSPLPLPPFLSTSSCFYFYYRVQSLHLLV